MGCKTDYIGECLGDDITSMWNVVLLVIHFDHDSGDGYHIYSESSSIPMCNGESDCPNGIDSYNKEAIFTIIQWDHLPLIKD